MIITFGVSSKRLIRIFLIAVGIIAVSFIVGLISKHVLGYGTLKGFVPQFDLNLEANIATWYSSTELFVAFLFLWAVVSTDVSD